MALAWAGYFFYSQLFLRIPSPTADFTGQTIIVTGSNTGLGLEAARHVARLGADKVILAVRTTSKGDTAADDIAKSLDFPRSSIEVWPLDMGDIESIQAFAMRAKTLKRLDGAILNAGVMSRNDWTNISGVESHTAVNVIGTFLLTALLRPIMAHSATITGLRGRLAIVGSDVMPLANRRQLDTTRPILDQLNDTSQLAPLAERYPLSKLLIFYDIHGFAEQFPVSTDSNVIVTVLTPGACHSDLFREGKPLAVSIAWAIVARTTEVGARTLVYGVEPDLPVEAHGQFLQDNRIWSADSLLSSPGDRELYQKWNAELWQYLEKKAPGLAQDRNLMVPQDMPVV